MKRTIYFRADAGPNIGMGHVSRCSSLASEAKNIGWETYLITDEHSKEWVLSQFDCVNFNEVFTLNEFQELSEAYGTVVIDSYMDTHSEFLNSRFFRKRISLVDPGVTPNHQVDLEVHQDMNTSSDSHSKMSQLIIDKYFFELRNERSDRNKSDLPKILITSGYTDSNGMIPAIVGILRESNSGFNAHIFSNHNFDFLDSRFHNLKPGINYRDALRSADFVITASGVSTWELHVAGIPFAFARTQENQFNNYTSLRKMRIGYPIGEYKDNNWFLESKSLLEYVSDIEQKHQLASNKESIYIKDVGSRMQEILF